MPRSVVGGGDDAFDGFEPGRSLVPGRCPARCATGWCMLSRAMGVLPVPRQPLALTLPLAPCFSCYSRCWPLLMASRASPPSCK
eukprot:10073401-Alexandrium_andersonii.AAC.1